VKNRRRIHLFADILPFVCVWLGSFEMGYIQKEKCSGRKKIFLPRPSQKIILFLFSFGRKW
jgi:hypothetical protein